MDMVQIAAYNVATCCYSRNSICHTLGITAGAHAECNTYNHGSRQCGFEQTKGGVGACLTSDCKYNDLLECRAPHIHVMSHSEHADCKTFQQRR